MPLLLGSGLGTHVPVQYSTEVQAAALWPAGAVSRGVLHALAPASLVPLRTQSFAQALVHPVGAPWRPRPPRPDTLVSAPPRGVVRLAYRAHAHALLAPRRAWGLALRAHVHRLLWRARMQLMPEGDGLLVISPEDKNLPFWLDYREDIPPRTAIADYRVWAQDMATGEDVTDRLITHTQQDGPSTVRVAVGNGDQQLGATYRVRCTVVLSNDPPTELPGHFDLPCVE